MNRKFLGFILVFFAMFILALNAESDKHFTSQASPSLVSVKAGQLFTIQAKINVAKGWHIYSIKTSQKDDEIVGPSLTEITFEQKELIEISGKIKGTKPKVKYDSAFQMKIGTYYGEVTFEIPVKALKNIDFKKDKINLIFYTQQCTETSCLPGMEFKINISKEPFKSGETDLSVEEITKDTSAVPQNSQSNNTVKQDDKSKPQQLTEDQKNVQDAKKGGLLSYILFAMGHGAAALLTPCVFPMVPITVSFFTKRNEKKKGKGLADSLVYALGIILTFTGIGIIFTSIFGPSGIQNLATNPFLNIGIATIFIVFALNLFGAFEIQIPTSILNKLNSKSQGNGMGSVLLMGLTFSLTSFTCTVPFVGNTLVSVGDGEWFYPVVGMIAFSSVFAAPFFLLALFPSAMDKLPRAGGWMNNVKVVMGFLEIAAAIKFISNADLYYNWGLMPRELFLSIWIVCCIMIVLYVLGIFRLHHDSPVESIGTPRILFAVLFATFALYLFSGFFDKKLGEIDAFLSPYGNGQWVGTTDTKSSSSSSKSNSQEYIWMDNYKEAFKLAKEQNKNIFIDFTGYQCTNCRWMELNMFSKKEVNELLGKYILVRLYTDRRGDPVNLANKDFQKSRFNSIDLPMYVIYTPNEELLGTKAFTRDQNEFVNFLKKGVK